MTENQNEAAQAETEEDVYVPKKILIVEDDVDISFIMKRRLEGLRPHDKIILAKTIYSGVMAIKEERPDFIFLDLNLPDGFGASSVADIRKYDKKTPIVVTTGLANEITTEECLKAGAHSLIIKSHITKTFLEETLDELIGSCKPPEPKEEAPAEESQADGGAESGEAEA